MKNMIGDIVEVKIEELKPHPKNPNKHPASQIERLTKIIKAQGFRNPIVVSNQTGFVIAGHGRIDAAKNAGFKTVPVSYQDFESETHEYAHMTADNALGDWSQLDMTEINESIIDLNSDFDLDLLGIERFKIDTSEFEVEKLENVIEGEAKDPNAHTCPACGYEFK